MVKAGSILAFLGSATFSFVACEKQGKLKGHEFIRLSAIIILTLVLMQSCGKNCKPDEFIQVTYEANMEKYFDVYKSGNWWLYTNTAGLVDSVYVTDYSYYTPGAINIKPCLSQPLQRMNLITERMSLSGEIEISYSALRTFTTFRLSAQGGGVWVHFNTSESYNSSGSISFIPTQTINGIEYSDLLRIDNGLIANSEYITQTVVFAPDYGLVQFITPNDTFSLSNTNL